MYPNNDIIYEAISKLAQCINVPVEVNSSEEDYNPHPTIRGRQFIIETKSAINTSNQGLVLSRME